MADDMRTVARELSRRLNTDRDFQERFAHDPQSALEEVGLKVDREKAEEIRNIMTASLLDAAKDPNYKYVVVPIR